MGGVRTPPPGESPVEQAHASGPRLNANKAMEDCLYRLVHKAGFNLVPKRA